MGKKITIIIILLMAVISAYAHYTLYSVTSGVKVESGTTSVTATKGMQLKASDYIVIPTGGKVEILNDLDKRIYSSTKTGRISVTRLMIDAKDVASDNGANIANRFRFGKKETAGDDRRVYVEKGMVKRSLTTYDPEGDGVQMDSRTLGRYIAAKIIDGIPSDTLRKPIKVVSEHPSEGGLTFHVENMMEFPVYFNIIKVNSGVATSVEISQLGQPDGSYVLLPKQTLSREHFTCLPKEDRHILIMANCQYDIDEVLDELSKGLSSPDSLAGAGDRLPVYIREL